MATIEDEIAGLREAIASGALRVRFQDGAVSKEVQYGTFDDLRRRMNYLLELQAATVTPARPRLTLATFGQG